MAHHEKAVSLNNASGQTSSDLLALPAEVRNCIYEMVFSDETIKVPNLSDTSRGGLYTAPGLLLACTQTYVEAISIFYAESRFRVKTVRRLLQWLNRIGPIRQQQLKAIHYAGTITPFTYCGSSERELLALLTIRAEYRAYHLSHLRSAGILVGDKAFKTHFEFHNGRIFWIHEPIALAQKFVQWLGEIKKNNPKIKHADAWSATIEHFASETVESEGR